MNNPLIESTALRDQRRNDALAILTHSVPYLHFMGIHAERRGSELTFVMRFRPTLLGNPDPPHLHGGATAGFLEVAASIQIAWDQLWPQIDSGSRDANTAHEMALPKTIDFTVDYLRAGNPSDAFARARVNRSGRRYTSVHVEAWQENHDKLFAQATGHFLMSE